MANQIGAITFDQLVPPDDKPIPPLVAGFEDETRHGSDGHGDRPIGTRGEAVLWRGLKDHTSAGDANTHIAAVFALRTATLVTTVDPWGTTVTTTVRVESVVVSDFRAIISGSNTHRTIADVLLRRTQ